ncbi:MAG: hypothetical protein Q4D87_03880 [Actinomycetaceae bacterium]|nr:hypothetical protein [Actinomycetaceae bacterium]
MGNLNPKKFQREADAAADAAVRHGEEWVAKAQQLVEEGADWVAPRAQKLWDETVKTAAPVIEDAADKVRPYLDEAEERGRVYLKDAQVKAEDYAKRGESAAKAAQKAASKKGSLAERAQRAGEATRKELTKPQKSKGATFGKVVGWTLLGSAAAGVGYLLWRRSQPIEDPWAEEYWADLDTDFDFPETPAEPVDEAETAGEVDLDNVEPRVNPKFDEETVEVIEEQEDK